MAQESIRDIRDTFSDLIDGNNRASSALQSTLNQTRSKSSAVEKEYNTLLEQFVLLALLQHDSKPEMLDKMSKAFSENMDLGAMYRDQQAANNKTISEYNRLTDIHGPLDKLQSSVATLNHELGKVRSTKTDVEEQIENDKALLQPVDFFNTQAEKNGRPKIDSQEGADYYHSKKGLSFVAAFVFDGHYRTGRDLVDKFQEENGLSIVDVQNRLKRNSDEPAALDRKMEEMIKAEPASRAPIAKMLELKKEIQTEEQVLEQAKNGIVHYLDDARFFNKVVAAMGDEFPVEAVQLRAKMESFKKVEDGLTQNIEVLRKATDNLETPMSKLNKGVRNGKGSKRVEMDLDGIKESYKKLQDASKKRAEGVQDIALTIENFEFTPEQLEKISGVAAANLPDVSRMTAGMSSSSYSPGSRDSGPDFLTMYMWLMIYDMSINDSYSAIDNGLLHSTFNDIPSSFSDFGTPSVDTSGFTDSFNVSAGLDSINVDTPSFNFDTPSFDTTSFDTTSFNVDIGTSNFDFGSSGGGGGFDFGSSGGFDSGGGGGGGFDGGGSW